jgi:histidinol-phosphate aminotransferase
MLIRPEIDSLPAYKPGVHPEEELRRWGVTEVTRLHNNEGPWEPVPEAIAAMQRALASLNRYPDQTYAKLKQALAAAYGVDASQIIVGNGSGSLIRLVAQVVLRPGDEVLVAWPPYPNYLVTAGLSGAEIVRVPLREGAMDLRAAVAAMTDRTRVVFIANPHNPTGSIVPRAELEWYFEQVPSDVATVLDEAYMEFVSEPGYPDGRAFLERGKPLLTLRTLSKVYGLAGLRIGFGVATPELSAAMHRARETFIISSLAVEAAVASLSRQDIVRERVASIAEGRRGLERLCDELGLRYEPSQANFVFIDVRRPARDVCSALVRRGILVRSGDVHQCPTWVRVSIGSPEAMQRFARAFREVLAEVPEPAGAAV